MRAMSDKEISPAPVKPEIKEGVIGPDNKKRPMQQGDHEMAKMGPEGDIKSIWDRGNPDEVEFAKKQFDKFVGEKKYLAFEVKKDGEQGEPITEFDPAIERMILVPPIQGG